ncbi:MAG: ABC transporter ATP-binding protein [Betaproteobacteria bacterium]|nr:ABC transporter ATP-binding protein [Betaproteobacteria bacterium]
MSQSVVRFSGVSKRFGANQVLRGIELGIESGQFFGLVGVNGTGKTTLLKCLLNFCDPDEGRIEVFGVAQHHPRSRARLTYLPERFMPPYFLTGREFLTMMLRLSGTNEAPGTVEGMLELLELDSSALGRPVRSYSKGMTQKLGIAACFLSGRDLYVLDEPMSGLDPKARALVKSLLLRLRREGRSLLMTSHSLADIEEICDHMAVLHNSSVLFSGRPGDLRMRHDGATLERAFLECIESAPHV